MSRRRPALVLLAALALLWCPLATAGLSLLPAASAAAQDFPEEEKWPPSPSRVTGVKMPLGTHRQPSGTVSFADSAIARLRAVGKAAGTEVNRREEFTWEYDPTPAQCLQIRETFYKALRAAGHVVTPQGKEENPDAHTIYFPAQRRDAKGGSSTVPGFWLQGKEYKYLVLVLGAAPGVLGPRVYSVSRWSTPSRQRTWTRSRHCSTRARPPTP